MSLIYKFIRFFVVLVFFSSCSSWKKPKYEVSSDGKVKISCTNYKPVCSFPTKQICSIDSLGCEKCTCEHSSDFWKKKGI